MTQKKQTLLGCGPAGLASAITCAKSGFRVLIIEEKIRKRQEAIEWIL